MTDIIQKPIRLKFIDDVFGINRMIAYQIAGNFIEAETPEQKEEYLKMRYASVPDAVSGTVIGDYDIKLLHYPGVDVYIVAINSTLEDPIILLSMDRHGMIKNAFWPSVVVQLQTWIKAYGRIMITSARKSRIGQYRKLLVRYFLTAEWSDHPNAGFFILPD